jgi:predicted TPR repeat methyltransferase
MKIRTRYPIAVDSNDHLIPRGALDQQGHEGIEFFAELRVRYPEIKSILDLGTGTGAFVANGLADDYEICGIDGTDAVDQTLPWAYYKNKVLFHADLRYSFTLGEEKEVYIDEFYGPTEYRVYPHKFDLITAWDVMEHLTEDTIGNTLDSITRHLVQQGYFMGTIEFTNTDNELYHHLCKPREWWLEKFTECGFEELPFDSIVLKARQSPIENCFILRRKV